MKKLVAANEKGGVGKSAIITQLAYYFYEQNLRVITIDLDHQMNTSSSIFKSQLATISSITSDKLLLTNVNSIEQNNFVLISASNELKKLEKNGQKHNTFANNLKNFLDSIDNQFDVCLIDTNPNPDIRLISALVTADYVLSPVQLNQEALDGIGALKRDINAIQQKINPKLNFIGILPNVVEPTPFQRENFVQLTTHYSDLMIKLDNGSIAAIQKRTAIAEAQALGQPVWKSTKSTGRSTWNEVKPVFEQIKKIMEL